MKTKTTILIALAVCIATIENVPAQTPWFITGNSGTNTSTNFIGTTDAKAFKIRTNNAVRITINSSGKVGIGTSSPTGKLHVKGNTDASQLVIDASASQTNAQPLIRLRNSAGIDLLHIRSDDTTNTFIGLHAGRVNDTTFLSTNGTRNTFIGSYAGAANYHGSHNTAVGNFALGNNTSGWLNTAIGNEAMRFNTSGGANTAIGVKTLQYNTTGYSNTAAGYAALNANSTGEQNTALGHQALYSNNGDRNSAFGFQALLANNTGVYNTAGGFYSMGSNTSGSINTAYGHYSLFSNTTGNWNTATGHQALYANNGTANTADGLNALYNNTSGNYNTGTGYQALFTNTSGSYNTAVGTNAGNGIGAGLSNFTGIGNGAGSGTSNSNTIELGNTSVTWIGGTVGWWTSSDRRIKDNIQSNVPGLSFITKLNPVTYNLNIHRQNEMCGINDTNEWEGKYDIEKITQTGFLAQEVEQAAKELNYDFNGVRAPTGNAKLYSIQYAAFVMPLVKAVQELDKTNEELKSRIEKLESILSGKISTTQQLNNSTTSLEQNSPNPFNSETEIKFQLPEKFSSAQLIITDANGKQVRSDVLKTSSSVIVKAAELAAGTYSYALVIDGVTIDSKQMVLTK